MSWHSRGRAECRRVRTNPFDILGRLARRKFIPLTNSYGAAARCGRDVGDACGLSPAPRSRLQSALPSRSAAACASSNVDGGIHFEIEIQSILLFSSSASKHCAPANDCAGNGLNRLEDAYHLCVGTFVTTTLAVAKRNEPHRESVSDAWLFQTTDGAAPRRCNSDKNLIARPAHARPHTD